MGYYASGDTRKTIHGCENDQGYDEREASRDASFNGLIARASRSDIRGGISLEARAPISDEADRPFWAEDESSSSESKQQLNERKKRRRTMSYRNNRIAIHKSRSSLFQSSNSSLDSVPDQISSRVYKQERRAQPAGRFPIEPMQRGYGVTKKNCAHKK
ncbi:uncharacterized protein LOC143374128 [Andrena cerasifolii]|uniref:uncharacterized protein LOC143374128 n=1 Tax=Andrena cerasifolii TaxID=2819439 RepID=UPI004037A56D